MLGEVGTHLVAEFERSLIEHEALHEFRMVGGEGERDRAASRVAIEVEAVESGATYRTRQSLEFVGDRVVAWRRAGRVQLELFRVRPCVRPERANERRIPDDRWGDDPR